MKKVFILLSLTLILCSCHRWQHQYPEDTERSRLTPAERLTNKWWKLDQVTKNGVNITDSVKAIVGNYTFLFGKVPDASTDWIYYYGKLNSNIDGNLGIVCFFQNDNAEIVIERVDGTSSIRIGIPAYTDSLNSFSQLYTILKLTEYDFKLKIEDSLQNTVISSYKNE